MRSVSPWQPLFFWSLLAFGQSTLRQLLLYEDFAYLHFILFSRRKGQLHKFLYAVKTLKIDSSYKVTFQVFLQKTSPYNYHLDLETRNSMCKWLSRISSFTDDIYGYLKLQWKLSHVNLEVLLSMGWISSCGVNNWSTFTWLSSRDIKRFFWDWLNSTNETELGLGRFD